MTVPAQVWAAVRSIPHPRQEPDMSNTEQGERPMEGTVSTAASPAHYGHHVWQDEDGETYYLAGHVPLRRAIAAANRYARIECGLANLYDDWPTDGLPGARHVWWRPDPDAPDADWMLPASASDPGAEPYTEVYL